MATLFDKKPDLYFGTVLSEDRQYRYILERTWDSYNNADNAICFVGLNPSTADETKDDATIRVCRNYAEAWGYARLIMVNLFAFRATEPKEMKRALDPVGAENNDWLIKASEASIQVVCAWGANGSFKDRDLAVFKMLHDHRFYKDSLTCLAVTKDGYPHHPLRLSRDIKTTPYMGRASFAYLEKFDNELKTSK